MKITFGKRTGSKFFFAALGAAAMLIFNIPAANAWIKGQFYYLTMPIARPAWLASSGASQVFNEILSVRQIAQENNNLRVQIAQMQATVAQIEYLKKENDLLHQALNLGLDKEYDLKESQIIGKDILRDVLIIGSGLDDGVREGFPVVALDKALVGRVIETYPKFSKVILATSKDVSFDVQFGNELTDGLARGQGNSSLLLDLVPKDKIINPGDVVVTSSLGGIFPEGLIVGDIRDVQKSDAQMFQKAAILPAFNISIASDVFVIMEFDVLPDAITMIEK